MKRILLTIVLASMTLTGCVCDTVPAGHVGIKVYLLGGAKGVDHEVVGVGRYWIGINEQLFLFPTFEQNPKYTLQSESDSGQSVEFQTREGMAVDADFSITYAIQAEKAAKVFQRYRSGIEEINRGPLRNILRDAVNEVASKLPVESVYGEGKVAMLDNVQTMVIARAEEAGITVSQVSLLGAMRLPEQVTTALNAKIEATQRAQQRENELREAEAAAKKEVATAEGRAQSLLTEAKAQAQANQILAESITNTLVEYERVKKWNGVMPTVTGVSSTILASTPLK